MNRYFPAFTVLFIAMMICISTTAQDSIAQRLSQSKVWISISNDTEVSGILISAQDSALLIFAGSMDAFKKQTTPTLTRIQYSNILIIRVQKKGAILRGMGIGLVTGLAGIIVYGPEGAVVGIALCVAAGAAYGALKKHTFKINGDIKKFNQFIKKFRQK